MKQLRDTSSLCPDCKRIIPANIYEEDGKVWMRKTCEKHGEVKSLYWGSYDLYKEAERYFSDGRVMDNPHIKKRNTVCPQDCGLCNAHKTHTVLGNIVVTNRCDLNCFYCYFYAREDGCVYEPSLDQIDRMVESMTKEEPVSCNAIQITGGEPSLREDIIDIVELVKSHDVDHILFNTNGIRLAKDPNLSKELKDSGVRMVYMSFDGVSEKTNPKNHWEAPTAIENCREAGLHIFLVPVIINSLNDHEAGDIIKFALKNKDVIRGVNFQPVSFNGRMPEEERRKYRITIPDLLDRIENQVNGEISKEDFSTVPSTTIISRFMEALTKRPVYTLSSHFACGGGTHFFEKEDGSMIALNRFLDIPRFLDYLDGKAKEIKNGKNRLTATFELIRDQRKFVDEDKKPEGVDISKLFFTMLLRRSYKFLLDVHKKAIFMGYMHFMDLYNYDIERVKKCCIHCGMVDGRVVPFCAYNVIPEIYRDKEKEKYGTSVRDWEEKTGKKIEDDIYKRNKEEWIKTDAYKKFSEQIEEVKKGSSL